MLKRFLDTLAMMGFLVRADPPRGEEREAISWDWGDPVNGWTVAARASRAEYGPKETVTLFVALRNEEESERQLRVPDWYFVFQPVIYDPNGAEAARSGYGREALKESRNTLQRDLSIAPGRWVSAEIPAGSLFELRKPGLYRGYVKCGAPGALETVRSREIEFSVVPDTRHGGKPSL